MNLFRRLPLPRLLLLCALVIAIGVSATALALALGSGPTPPPKPLAQAVHDALAGPAPEGLSADVTLTDNLLEGASLAANSEQGGSGLSGNPLVSGGSGRLWIDREGRFRLELQSEQGDTEVTWDGSAFVIYDTATNTVYRYTPKQNEHRPAAERETGAEVPSVARIEEAISRLREHASLSAASPVDVAGQPAYTVSLAPKEGGSLLGAVALSFDAANGVPLRTAVYSSQSSSPVIELAATSISFGPVDASTLQVTPPADATVKSIELSSAGQRHDGGRSEERPKLTLHGHGPAAIAVLEAKQHGKDATIEGLPTVRIDGATASELRTELGTLLTFERGGVRYLLAGSTRPSAVEALARGL